MKNILIRYGRSPKDVSTEAFRFTVIVLLLLVLVRFFPIFALSMVLIPAIYTALSYRTGLLFPLLSLLFVSLFLIFLGVDLANLNALTTGAIMGIAVGEINYRKNDMITAITVGMLILVANHVIILYLYKLANGSDIVPMIVEEMQKILAQNNMANTVNEYEMKAMLQTMLPGAMIAQNFVSSVLNYFIAGKIANVNTPENKPFKSFWEFTIPGSASVACLVTLITVLLFSLAGYAYQDLTTNLMVIFITILLIQGLSVVDFMFLREKALLIRMTVMLFLMFFTPVLLLLGVLDAIANIRRLPR
ncbi:MAG: DUF2232 domain-containing protein [Peptostreptococcaceae bacterium]|nr:DUF2232 domain-containing protein [Peptostreptococcaceae bacterium]